MIDCRQNLLATIHALLKKAASLQTHPEEKRIASFVKNVISNLELLKNDLVLLFNQNFYLRCKLD